MAGLGFGNLHILAEMVIVTAVVYFGLAPGIWRYVLSKATPLQTRRSFRYTNRAESGLTDVGQQLNAVMIAPFEKRRVLSASEYRAFKVIEDEIAAMRKGYRVFAQTSLGEVLTSTDSDAFHSINSKRVDILVVDCGGWPVVAVEYQGGRHYQGTAAARDAVKREAPRKAGVHYIEISSSDSDGQIRSRLQELLGWKNGAQKRDKFSVSPQFH